MALSLSGAAALRPYLTQKAVDEHIIQMQFEGFLYIIIIIGLVLITEVILQYLYVYQAGILGQDVVKELRRLTFIRIIKSPLRYFDQNKVGTLVTRVVSDIETVSNIFSQGLITILGDLLKIFAYLCIMFYLQWELALITIFMLPFIFIVTRWFQKSIKKTFHDVRTQVARLNAFVQERITGMQTVQILNREKSEMKKFEQINAQHRDANIRTIWYFSIYFPVIEIFSSITIALVVWYGGLRSIFGIDITIGTLIAFMYLIQSLYRPLRQIADKFNTIQMGIVACERVFSIIDHNIAEESGDLVADNIRGEVSFKNVTFEYKEGEPVLRDISFDIEAGETVAFVGASGSGKTTLASLMSRFYEIKEGSITIDGRDIKDYDLQSLRSHIAVVLQDVFLFSDSIWNNITLYDEVEREEVIQAAKDMDVLRFIKELPGEFHFNVKERGSMLSVGQRQLLSFLRAYLSHPSILILDEASSSIDSHTEKKIQQVIGKISENQTSIIIAHRLATIQHADKIIVLEKGEIKEIGSHDVLMQKDGYYKKFYDAQIAEVADEATNE